MWDLKKKSQKNKKRTQVWYSVELEFYRLKFHYELENLILEIKCAEYSI